MVEQKEALDALGMDWGSVYEDYAKERERAARSAGYASWETAIRETADLPAAEVADSLGVTLYRVQKWRRTLLAGRSTYSRRWAADRPSQAKGA